MKNPSKMSKVQLKDSKGKRFVATWESSWKCILSLTNQLRQPNSFLSRGDNQRGYGKDFFRCCTSHRKQPTLVREREVAKGAPLANDQTALERDFSPFNDD